MNILSGTSVFRKGVLYASLFAAAAVCVLPEIARAAGSEEIISEFRQKYGKDVTFETAFELEILWKARERLEKKQGTLYLAPGDRFRLEMDGAVWVSDGRTYWQYSQTTNQVVIRRLLDVNLSMQPSRILSRYLFELEYSVFENSDRQTVLEWTAAEGESDQSARKVMVWIEKNKLLLRKLWIVDASGNESTYTFKKTRVGGSIPGETFTFKTPAGASVLDTRE